MTIDPPVIAFGLGVGILIGLTGIAGVPPGALRLALGCTLLGSALAMMNKAGADLPTWTIVGMPALVGLLAFATHRSRPPDARTA